MYPVLESSLPLNTTMQGFSRVLSTSQRDAVNLFFLLYTWLEQEMSSDLDSLDIYLARIGT